MAAKKDIPSEVRKQVDKIVDRFNQTIIKDALSYYVTRYKGRFLYLDRYMGASLGPVCRLEYTGHIKRWEFAIFRYSSERYDPDEWLFPGAGFVDGTVEGAMKAGLAAYP